MNVLITGGNGFLGSHVVRTLLQKNYNILVISRKCNSLVDILDNIKFVQQKGGYAEHTKTIQEFQPNYILHFAWDGGNSYSDVNSLKQFSTNIPYGIELLEIVNSLSNKPIFMGVGSFAEYGIITQKAEETQNDNPETFYGMAKSTFKTISKKFCDDNNIAWCWIRPCYIYGTNDVSTRLIPSVIQKLLEGKDIHLDSCNVTIDYLHVNDFSSAILRILETKSTGIFNVCSGEEYRLRDVLRILSSDIIFDTKLDRTSSSSYICGDNSNLKKIGWTPNISLHDGLISLYSSTTT
jgi:nucleoside-diphosphate-sugar epimerase